MTDFRASAESVPVTAVEQLVAGFHEAGKPRERWKIGAEYEKVAVDRATGRAAPLPGAQLELSGAQFRTLHEAERELATHVREILSVGDELGLAFLGLGMQPISP